VVDVVDLFQMRVFHQRDLVETGHDFAHVLKRCLQAPQRLHVGLRTHEFIVIQDRQTVLVAHGDY